MLSETRLAKIHEMEQILNEANSLMKKWNSFNSRG